MHREEGLEVVSEVKRYFLHHFVPRDWNLSDGGAVVAARHVGNQRLG